MLLELLDSTRYYFSEKQHADFINGKKIPDAFVIYLAKVIECHCLVAVNWSKERIYQRTEEMETWLEKNVVHSDEESYKYDSMWTFELGLRHKVQEFFNLTDGRWMQFSIILEHGYYKIKFEEDYRLVCFHLGIARPEDMPPEGYNAGVIKHRNTPALDLKFGRANPTAKAPVVKDLTKFHKSLTKPSTDNSTPTDFIYVPDDGTDFDVSDKDIINIVAEADCTITVSGLGKKTRVALKKDEYVQLSQRNNIVIVGVGFDPVYRDGYLAHATSDMTAEIANIKSRCFIAGDDDTCLTSLDE